MKSGIANIKIHHTILLGTIDMIEEFLCYIINHFYILEGVGKLLTWFPAPILYIVIEDGYKQNFIIQAEYIIFKWHTMQMIVLL